MLKLGCGLDYMCTHFSNSILLHFYNLATYSSVCVGEVSASHSKNFLKLQPNKVVVTEKSIFTVSIGKINYRCLLKRM